ncbi:hypothetical protein ABK040_014063 [Willaertia magna]
MKHSTTCSSDSENQSTIIPLSSSNKVEKQTKMKSALKKEEKNFSRPLLTNEKKLCKEGKFENNYFVWRGSGDTHQFHSSKFGQPIQQQPKTITKPKTSVKNSSIKKQNASPNNATISNKLNNNVECNNLTSDNSYSNYSAFSTAVMDNLNLDFSSPFTTTTDNSSIFSFDFDSCENSPTIPSPFNTNYNNMNNNFNNNNYLSTINIFPTYNFEEVNAIFNEIPLQPTLGLKLSKQDIEELCNYPNFKSIL